MRSISGSVPYNRTGHAGRQQRALQSLQERLLQRQLSPAPVDQKKTFWVVRQACKSEQAMLADDSGRVRQLVMLPAQGW